MSTAVDVIAAPTAEHEWSFSLEAAIPWITGGSQSLTVMVKV